MRHWSRKKTQDDDMLIVHTRPPDKEHPGRESGETPELTTSPAEERTQLERRLAGAVDPAERQAVITLIQERLGNAVAEEMIRGARDRAEPPPAPTADEDSSTPTEDEKEEDER